MKRHVCTSICLNKSKTPGDCVVMQKWNEERMWQCRDAEREEQFGWKALTGTWPMTCLHSSLNSLRWWGWGGWQGGWGGWWGWWWWWQGRWWGCEVDWEMTSQVPRPSCVEGRENEGSKTAEFFFIGRLWKKFSWKVGKGAHNWNRQQVNSNFFSDDPSISQLGAAVE